MKTKLIIFAILISSSFSFINSAQKEEKENVSARLKEVILPKPSPDQWLRSIIIPEINKSFESLKNKSYTDQFETYKDLYGFLSQEGIDFSKQLLPSREMSDLAKEQLNNTNKIGQNYHNAFSKEFQDIRQYWPNIYHILSEMAQTKGWNLRMVENL